MFKDYQLDSSLSFFYYFLDCTCSHLSVKSLILKKTLFGNRLLFYLKINCSESFYETPHPEIGQDQNRGLLLFLMINYSVKGILLTYNYIIYMQDYFES